LLPRRNAPMLHLTLLRSAPVCKLLVNTYHTCIRIDNIDIFAGRKRWCSGFPDANASRFHLPPMIPSHYYSIMDVLTRTESRDYTLVNGRVVAPEGLWWLMARYAWHQSPSFLLDLLPRVITLMSFWCFGIWLDRISACHPKGLSMEPSLQKWDPSRKKNAGWKLDFAHNRGPRVMSIEPSLQKWDPSRKNNCGVKTRFSHRCHNGSIRKWIKPPKHIPSSHYGIEWYLGRLGLLKEPHYLPETMCQQLQILHLTRRQ